MNSFDVQAAMFGNYAKADGGDIFVSGLIEIPQDAELRR